MKRPIVMIGILVIATFTALVLSAGAVSYLYNKTWLASGSDIPECLLYAPVTLDCAQDGEYLNGLSLWSNVTQFGILIAGAVIGVKLYRKKVVVRSSS